MFPGSTQSLFWMHFGIPFRKCERRLIGRWPGEQDMREMEVKISPFITTEK